jgi:putative PIN family toxin of toxin-antitoxin system
MRVVLDTNILLSALLVHGTPPDELYEAWRDGRFELASCNRQIEEIKRVCRRPFFLARLKRSEVGRLINAIRRLAVMCERVPSVAASPDPDDDYLLALAQAAEAQFLVTGDRSGLLALERFGSTRIVTARTFLAEIA